MSVAFFAKLLFKVRYVMLVAWLATTIGCGFVAVQLNKHTTQDTPPPPGSPSAAAKAIVEQYFPATSLGTGYVIFMNAETTDINIGLDPRVLAYDLGLQVYCTNETIDPYNSTNPQVNFTSRLIAYSSFRAVAAANLPLPVALQYLAPTNLSAFVTVLYSLPYDHPITVEYTKGLNNAINVLTARNNLTGILTTTVLSLPTFLEYIANSSSDDSEKMFYIVLPISILLFSAAIWSGRLMIIPLFVAAATYCTSFAIVDLIARSYRLNSMAPSICVFLLLSYTLTYSFYFLSQYRKLLALDKEKYIEPLTAVEALLKTAGRSTLISCTTIGLTSTGLLHFDHELVYSLSVAILVVITVNMCAVLTIIPCSIAAFPTIFASSIDVWVNAIHPAETMEAKAVHREEKDVPETRPLYRRVHNRLINFVSLVTTRYFFIGLVFALCAIPLSYAFDGTYSNSLEQYMPKSNLLTQWHIMQSVFKVGEVFQANLIIDTKTMEMDDHYYSSTLDIVYSMINQLPQTYASDFDGPMISGVESGYLPNGGNITLADIAACGFNFADPQCLYLLILTYAYHNQTFTQVQIRPSFHPTSAVGMQWIRDARALLAEKEKQYNYTIYLSGYAAQTYDIVSLAESVLVRAVLISAGILFACLLVFFGSVLIPIKVLLSTFLSVGTAFGFANLVYGKGILSFIGIEANGGIAWQVPLCCLIVCAGIALNVEMIVLISILDTRWHGVNSRVSIVKGVAAVGREVTISTLVSAINFAGLIGSTTPALAQIGVFFLLTMLVQGLLLRLFFTPALMSVSGDWNWWPMQWLVKYFTPLAVENADDFRPALVDKEDLRRSRVSVAGYRNSMAARSSFARNRVESGYSER